MHILYIMIHDDVTVCWYYNIIVRDFSLYGRYVVSYYTCGVSGELVCDDFNSSANQDTMK